MRRLTTNNRYGLYDARLMRNLIDNAGVVDDKGDLCADAERVSAFRMWTPIKDYQRTFDGRGFSISGIYYDSDAVGNHGLFAKVDGQGKVKGLRLLDSYFRGSNHVGSICGENNGEISRCYSNATVWSDNYAGGIVSKNSGKLNHSWFDGHVSAIKADIGVAGGLVGYLRGSIDGCLFTGRLSVLSTQPDLPTDDYRHGVLVGATSTSDHSTVINSFATAGKDLVINRSDGLLTTSNIGFLTAYQLESGEACWLLNGGVEKDGEHPVWRQTIGKDLVPNYYNSIVKYDPDHDFFFNFGMPFDPTIAHLTNSIRRGVEQDVIDRIVKAIIDKK